MPDGKARKVEDSIIVTRIENKLSRLIEQYEEYSRFQGQDVDELLDGLLEMRQVTKEGLIDMGFLLYLKAYRLKLAAFQLVADITGMELAEEAETALDEIEAFYQELQRELERARQGLLGYTPKQPEEKAPAESQEWEGQPVKKARGLYNAITGFFDQAPEPAATFEIPEMDLLDFYEHVDFNKLQRDVLAQVRADGGQSSVRAIAGRFLFGNERRTLALVFMACLFLEGDTMVVLEQGVSDVMVFLLSARFFASRPKPSIKEGS